MPHFPINNHLYWSLGFRSSVKEEAIESGVLQFSSVSIAKMEIANVIFVEISLLKVRSEKLCASNAILVAQE